MASEFMSCTVEPELKVKPGSIAGPGGNVTVTLVKTKTRRCSRLKVEYELLGSNYIIDESKTSWEVTLKKPNVAEVIHRIEREPPETVIERDYEIELPIVRKGKDASDAALKIGARIQGQGKHGKLDPVHAIGSVAVLTGGLRKRMKAEGFEVDFPATAAGKAKLEAAALKFIRKTRPALEKQFPKLEWPTDETIKNAILGDTKSLQDTIQRLEPVIEHLRKEAKEGILEDFQKGLIKNLAPRFRSLFRSQVEASKSL